MVGLALGQGALVGDDLRAGQAQWPMCQTSQMKVGSPELHMEAFGDRQAATRALLRAASLAKMTFQRPATPLTQQFATTGSTPDTERGKFVTRDSAGCFPYLLALSTTVPNMLPIRANAKPANHADHCLAAPAPHAYLDVAAVVDEAALLAVGLEVLAGQVGEAPAGRREPGRCSTVSRNQQEPGLTPANGTPRAMCPASGKLGCATPLAPVGMPPCPRSPGPQLQYARIIQCRPAGCRQASRLGFNELARPDTRSARSAAASSCCWSVARATARAAPAHASRSTAT